MITIINYGLGNIRAFVNVFTRLNIPVKIASSPQEILGASKIVLPGVGAFDYAMKMLNQTGIRDVLDEEVLLHKKPILGICLGMQIMGNRSDEGNMAGLGWIDGDVIKFNISPEYGTYLPHMGWNTAFHSGDIELFRGIELNARFYFLHSYFFQCNNSSNSIATTKYGVNFTSSINKENIYGVQFHPEKSHQNGITVLHNFSRI